MKCKVESCGVEVKTMGYCGKHYDKMRRHGDPLFQRPPRKNYKEISWTEPDGTRVRIHEHRYVMEKHMGRKLERLEYVHHKDHNIHNNDISNLEILTPGEHNREHWKGTFRKAGNSETTKTCPTCKEIKTKTLEFFWPDKPRGRGDGWGRQCKLCARESNKDAVARYRAKKKIQSVTS